MPELIAYQDEAYARRYADVVKRVVAAEQRCVPGKTALAEAAARYLYKLMAYKDEYEVARLHTDPAFLAQLDAHVHARLQRQVQPGAAARSPSATRSPATCRRAVRRLDAHGLPDGWPSSRACVAVRSTIFGKTEERRMERQLIEDYIAELEEICAGAHAGQPCRSGGAGQRAR